MNFRLNVLPQAACKRRIIIFFAFYATYYFLPTKHLKYFHPLHSSSWQLCNLIVCRLLVRLSLYSQTEEQHHILPPLPIKLIGPSGRVPPIIRQGPANQTVSRGATAQLHCRVIGGPSVKISWEKDGERLLGNKPRLTLMENGTLQITDVKVCVSVCVCVK